MAKKKTTRSTIYDVAKLAGVGVGTVSRVLNNSENVRPATRDKVLEAIEQLQFKPNTTARQLSRKSVSRYIGVITLPFTNYHSFAHRLRGVHSALRDVDQQFEVLLYTASSPERYDRQLRQIAQDGSVDGLVVLDIILSDEQLSLLRNARIPFVGINHEMDSDWAVVTDNHIGSKMATNHLIELGHKRIAYVGDSFDSVFHFPTSRQRYDGYLEAMKAANLPIRDDYLSLNPYGYEYAQQSMQVLLDLPEQPTAVFAVSDVVAIGCITAIRNNGLRVPEDISVIGYDDLDLAEYTGLTTIRQHIELSGHRVAEYLLEVIQGNGYPEKPPALPPLQLILRQTTLQYPTSVFSGE